MKHLKKFNEDIVQGDMFLDDSKILMGGTCEKCEGKGYVNIQHNKCNCCGGSGYMIRDAISIEELKNRLGL